MGVYRQVNSPSQRQYQLPRVELEGQLTPSSALDAGGHACQPKLAAPNDRVSLNSFSKQYIPSSIDALGYKTKLQTHRRHFSALAIATGIQPWMRRGPAAWFGVEK